MPVYVCYHNRVQVLSAYSLRSRRELAGGRIFLRYRKRSSPRSRWGRTSIWQTALLVRTTTMTSLRSARAHFTNEGTRCTTVHTFNTHPTTHTTLPDPYSRTSIINTPPRLPVSAGSLNKIHHRHRHRCREYRIINAPLAQSVVVVVVGCKLR